ncbi:MAG: asparagine synthetase A [Thermoplasmatota archaeon]
MAQQATTQTLTTPTEIPAEAEWHRLASARGRRMLHVQAGILRHVRAVLDEAACLEALPPIMGPVTDPGTRGAKQGTVDYYGERYKLMSSAILYKQLLLWGTERAYLVAPCIRLEPHETAGTGRHLTEFFQVDVELRDGRLEDAVDLAEHLIREVVGRIWETHADDLEALGAPHWDLARPFVRLTHAEAVARLAELGYEMPPHAEIPWEGEKILSAASDVPVIIQRYPRGSRGFYDREDPDEPGILLDFDVLYPGGFGEAVSGAEREHDLGRVVGRMREAGEDVRKYGWYLEMLRDGCPASAGFGIGVERLTRFVCGFDSVTDARPYPKVAGQVSP